MSAFLKRVAASAAASVMIIGGAVLPSQASEPEYGSVEQRDNATITIHKMVSGSLTTGNVSADVDNGQGTGLVGVPFKLFRLNLDLTTAQGWNTLSGMTVRSRACTDEGEPDYSALGSGIAADPQTQPQTVTTGAGGTIQATVSTGAYLVCEQPADNVTNAAGEKVTVIGKASPFVVTAPTPHPGGKGWLYNVHVYPKNTILEASTIKTEVTKPGLKQENGVNVTIDVTIPSLGEDEHFDYFGVVDPLPAGMDNPTDYDVKIISKSDAGEQQHESLVKDDHYIVRHKAQAPQNNALAVRFSRTGFQKLYNHPNKTLRIAFKTTMNTLPATGQVNNAAWVYMDRSSRAPESQNPAVPISWPNEPGGEPGVTGNGIPPLRTKNIVGLTWGNFTINKVDAAKTDTGLQGATFKVYVAEDQTTCDGSNLNITGDALMVGTDEEFTTGPNGQVTFGGAHLNTASVEAGDPEPGKTRCFIIEETAAPAGYILPSGDNAKRAVLVNSTQPGQAVQVTNQQVTNVPQLPLTGASGRAILLLVGTALMLSSLGAFLLLRRRVAANR